MATVMGAVKRSGHCCTFIFTLYWKMAARCQPLSISCRPVFEPRFQRWPLLVGKKIPSCANSSPEGNEPINAVGFVADRNLEFLKKSHRCPWALFFLPAARKKSLTRTWRAIQFRHVVDKSAARSRGSEAWRDAVTASMREGRQWWKSRRVDNLFLRASVPPRNRHDLLLASNRIKHWHKRQEKWVCVCVWNRVGVLQFSRIGKRCVCQCVCVCVKCVSVCVDGFVTELLSNTEFSW